MIGSVMSVRASFVLMGWIVSLTSGCSPQDGGFAGEGGRAVNQSPKPPKTEEPPKNEQPLPSKPVCTEAKLESVNSLTSFVDQRTWPGTLDLELNFQPCPRQAGRVELPILFDIDANTMFKEVTDKRMTYEVTIQGVRVAGPGFVNTVMGQDLFGKKGADFAHFRSDTSLSVAPDISTARLRVKLDPMLVISPVNKSSAPTTNFTVPIYVRVGDSAPVTTTVTFSPAGVSM